ncbi:MAG: hypothetical protein NT027_11800 [Proteobacteria bacterium]|nr:hypothetical protein [Pseudomonadota bacterium]
MQNLSSHFITAADLLVVFLVFGCGIIYPVVGWLIGLGRVGSLLSRKPRFTLPKSMQYTFEVLYGLILPLVFLIVFLPALRGSSIFFVTFVGLFAGWICVWAARFSAVGTRIANLRRFVSLLSIATIFWSIYVTYFAIGSLRSFTLFGSAPFDVFSLLSLGNFVGAIALSAYYFQVGKESDFFLFGRQRQFGKVLAIIAFVASPLVVYGWINFSTSRHSIVDSNYYLKQRSEDIRATAQKFDLPAQSIAIVLRMLIDDVPEAQRIIEPKLASLALVDRNSHFLMSKGYDLSIGPAQIKVTTAQSALMIQRLNSTVDCDIAQVDRFAKEGRDAWVPTKDFCFAGKSSSSAFSPRFPWPEGLSLRPSKVEIADYLFSSRGSIEMMALILKIYDVHWQERENISLSRRPDILATLYTLGFQKSKPHSAPKPSSFGEVATTVSSDSVFRELGFL